MRKLLLLFIVILSISSCKILRPSLMLKTPKDYVFDQISDTMSEEEYRISATDDISLRILSNEGFKLVDFSNSGASSGNSFAGGSSSTSLIQTLVEHDGTIKVPLIGRVKVQGLTMREAEQVLETKFSEFYVGPYVILRVTNKRVSVFPGSGGIAKVVPI